MQHENKNGFQNKLHTISDTQSQPSWSNKINYGTKQLFKLITLYVTLWLTFLSIIKCLYSYPSNFPPLSVDHSPNIGTAVTVGGAASSKINNSNSKLPNIARPSGQKTRTNVNWMYSNNWYQHYFKSKMKYYFHNTTFSATEYVIIVFIFETYQKSASWNIYLI